MTQWRSLTVLARCLRSARWEHLRAARVSKRCLGRFERITPLRSWLVANRPRRLSAACSFSLGFQHGSWTEARVETFAAPILGCLCLRTHFLVIHRQDGGLIVIDGLGILADVAGIVDTPGQFAKFPLFDGLEQANADLGRFGDLLERNAPIPSNGG